MEAWDRPLTYIVMLLTCIMASALSLSSHTEGVYQSTCTQNCSWRSYDRDASEWVENRCEMTNPGNDAIGCPSIYPPLESTSSQPSQVEQFGLVYHTRRSTDNSEILCANITFRVRRPGVDLVKAIRLTLIGKTYKDLNKHYCAVWDIKSQLSFCSLSSNNCSVNDDVRTFYYDCFCGLDPGSTLPSNEGYLLSVDTLPKLKGQYQEFELVRTPGCQDFRNHKNCRLTPKENWRPLFSSLDQLCNFSSISITFDLPPLEYDVKMISVYLYKEGGRRSVWRKSDLNVSQLDNYEKFMYNTTYNVTTLICNGPLQLNCSYYLGIRVRDEDGTSYVLKRMYSTATYLRSPPCTTNPCSTREVCTEDCFNYTCECEEDSVRIKAACQVPWYPKDLKVTLQQRTHNIVFAESPPHNSRIEKFRIGLFTNEHIECTHAQTTMDPNGTIYASFKNLQVDKTYTPAVKIDDECPSCKYKFYNSSRFAVTTSVVAVPEDTPPKTFIVLTSFAVLSITLLAFLIYYHRRHKTSKGRVRLICSQNSYIQNFTNKLRQALQLNLKNGCKVSVETLHDTSQEGMNTWLDEAKRKGDKLCFILDHNLTILDFEESRGYCMTSKVHSLVESVPINELKSPVLLKFDFIPTESIPDWQQCMLISLPSGLGDLLKNLYAEANLSLLRCNDVLDAYIKIKNILEQKMCHRSIKEWSTLTQNIDEGSVGTGFLSQSVLTLDEEDANFELVEASVAFHQTEYHATDNFH